MQSLPPSSQNLEDWANKYQSSWWAEYWKKYELWQNKLDDEKRGKYVEQIITHFARRILEDKIDGIIEFMAWLRSPEGAIVYGYIWRPEYVAR